MANDKIARLEDFGARGVVSPAERFKVYQEQAKGLAPKVRARFWLGVLERDPDVRKLLDLKEKNRRRRF
jgi:hypothetical protein